MKERIVSIATFFVALEIWNGSEYFFVSEAYHEALEWSMDGLLPTILL